MIRARLARLFLRLIGPELHAEIKRIAEAEANYAGAVAMTLAETKIAAAQATLTGQDEQTLALVIDAFGARDRIVNDICAIIYGRADALPGDTKPAREDAAFEVVPPSKLN